MRAGSLVVSLAAFVLLAAPQCVSGSAQTDGPAPQAEGRLVMLPSGALAPSASSGEDAGSAMREPTTGDMLFSLILPGLGELRSGHKNRAAMHLAAEAAVWVSFIVFRVQGELRKDDFVEHARVFGGVGSPEGQSADYYRYLANYRSSDPGPDSYNEEQVRQTARVLFPDDLEARQRYIDENEIRGELAWNWETKAAWRTFRELRESSELSFQRSRFSIAAAVANRIASVLGLAQTRGPAGSSVNVGVRRLSGGDCYATSVSLSKNF